MTRQRIIQTIREILTRNGVTKAYLFGSFARKDRRYHDIDIAIKTPKGFSLLDLAHLENILEEKTQKKIDLGTIGSIHPRVKKYIEKDLISIL